MNPEDDPEDRIRALEQPLADTARASELGGPHRPAATSTNPPGLSPASRHRRRCMATTIRIRARG